MPKQLTLICGTSLPKNFWGTKDLKFAKIQCKFPELYLKDVYDFEAHLCRVIQVECSCFCLVVSYSSAFAVPLTS